MAKLVDVDEFGKMVVLIKGAVVVVGTNVDDDKFVLGVQVVLNPVDVSVHVQVVLVEGQLVWVKFDDDVVVELLPYVDVVKSVKVVFINGKEVVVLVIWVVDVLVKFAVVEFSVIGTLVVVWPVLELKVVEKFPGEAVVEVVVWLVVEFIKLVVEVETVVFVTSWLISTADNGRSTQSTHEHYRRVKISSLQCE